MSSTRIGDVAFDAEIVRGGADAAHVDAVGADLRAFRDRQRRRQVHDVDELAHVVALQGLFAQDSNRGGHVFQLFDAPVGGHDHLFELRLVVALGAGAGAACCAWAGSSPSMATATADAIGVSRQRRAPGVWVPVIIVSVIL
jgi:hypothetical protein